MMLFAVVSIFPNMFASLTDYGISARALDKNICRLQVFNPRDYVSDPYRRIDDKPFGGGAGMVMMAQPLESALNAACDWQRGLGADKPFRIFLSPQGKTLDQQMVNDLSQLKSIVLVCGRYEGVDERFIEQNIDLELSIGDLVVSGGELPAMLALDAIIRQLPGSLNDEDSANAESFMHGLLDYPHYTQPRVYGNKEVPSVLLSGDHKQIKRWRLQMSLWRTYQRRPDLLKKHNLTKAETALLDEMININQPTLKKEL